MRETAPQQLELLRTEFGGDPFRISAAIGLGVSRAMLYRLRDGGQLASVSRGVLQLPEGGLGMLSDLAAVSARVPGGTICLNSALAYWDLADEIPHEIHLAVPRGAHRPRIGAPRTRVHVFVAETFAVGRQQEQTDAGEPFWVYSAERSVVDALRMTRFVGSDVALQALSRYVRRRGSRPAQLTDIARRIGGSRRLHPALEALLS